MTVHNAAAEMAHIPEWELIDDVGLNVSSSPAPTYYISGPMSGYVGHNFEVFARAKAHLIELGYGVESPADNDYVEEWDWLDYIQRDLSILRTVQGIVVLPNFRTSPGACIEVIACRRMGLPLFKLDGSYYKGELRQDGRLDYGPDDMDIVAAHGDVSQLPREEEELLQG